LDTDARLSLCGPPIVAEMIEGEVVIINLDTGVYFSLRRAGASAWCLLMEGKTVAEAAGALSARYDVAADEVRRAVVALVEELLAERIVAPAPAARGADAASGRGQPSEVGERGRGSEPFEECALQRFTDMKDLLLLDPIHDVAADGWPSRPEGSSKDPKGA
jgi:hypothetical protein